MDLKLRDSLPRLVKPRYDAAKESHAVVFAETKLALLRHQATGTTFQLRYCPGLARKPTASAPKQNKQAFNPFEDPPQDMLVARVPTDKPTHNIVLNKFPIIPEHIILATRLNKEQTRMLEPTDVVTTYACLKAWEKDNSEGRLFAFFNSGPHSGASQPHRHLQFVPVEGMTRDVPQCRSWQPLIDKILEVPPSGSTSGIRSLAGLPFRHSAITFPPNPSTEQLYDIYLRLLARICDVPADATQQATFSPPCSYNLGMTTSGMAIVKRRSESLSYTDEAGEHTVAVNGTILAGTLMVKGQAEWDLLRRDASKLDEVLAAIGEPVGSMDKL